MRVCRLAVICLCLMALESGCRGNDNVTENADLAPGVSVDLATQRARSIESLSYILAFNIPATPSEPIAGKATIRFSTKDVTRPHVLDFSSDATQITSFSCSCRSSHFREVKETINIPIPASA